MKKLIILASVCAMAFTSQAYDFKWGASNVRVPKASDPHTSESGIKVTSDSPAFGGDYGSLSLQLYVLAADGISDPTLVGSKTVSAANMTAFAIFDDESDTYAAIVKDWTADKKPTFQLVAEYVTSDGVYNFSGDYVPTKAIGDLTAGNITLGTNMANGSWNYTANAIPEPTSGLLLLLGVAGLALRRRRA